MTEPAPEIRCPAPAKLNLFLHVTGRRPDGYHTLQTVFQFIDLADALRFTLRRDGAIRRVSDIPGVPEEADLAVRAARALQADSGTGLGADIAIEKRIPMGGGLGGGSSDAATTLIALNRMWGAGRSRSELMRLALPLGADVPAFVFGRNAFGQGIGEELVALEIPRRWFVVVMPRVRVPTEAIFRAPELTRNTKTVKITDFSADGHFAFDFGRNDLQSVAASRFPEVDAALNVLGKHARARMSGSGACVFSVHNDREDAQRVADSIGSAAGDVWVAEGLERHPLSDWVS